MGFVQRAFTPPGTGGREAAEIQAATNAARVSAMPSAPSTPPPPTPPPGATAFSPSATAAQRKTAGITAGSILGAAATASQSKKPTLG